MDGPTLFRELLIRKVITERTTLAGLLGDADRLEEFVRATATGIKHVSGTCRMGPDADPMAVTGTDGRVYKVEALRVVDASLMPSLPRANTNIPTVMMAEKIADAIR
jgi:5-(hydroxymethyl)furfural/furfural oxidase